MVVRVHLGHASDATANFGDVALRREDESYATLHVFGTKAGGVCFDEKRTFEGNGGNVVVDTIKSASALPASLALQATETIR